ncbi:MAG: endonuclease V [Gammaproteobacteria bacterium]
MRHQVVHRNRLDSAGLAAGVDALFASGRAAAVTLTFPALQRHEYALAQRPCAFPYRPGLLSIRETPLLLDARGRLRDTPQLIVCGGHGCAHLRRFGLACHLGVLTGLPTVGAAKKRLIGHDGPPPDRRGAWVPLGDDDETVGAVLRTRAGVRPVYVAVGHRVSLETAVRCTMACVTRQRLPETTRWAHHLASHPPGPAAG